MNGEANVCQNCKQEFTIEAEDFKFYEKMAVPPPTLCPECRLIRRLAFRNERTFYKRKCDFTGEEVISIFAPDKPYTVYQNKIWWSDKWDPLSYGREYDFSKPFFEQFGELMLRIPWANLIGSYQTWVNSEYNNHASFLKDCYMVTHTSPAEGCMYSSDVSQSKDCVDGFKVNESELCYDSLYLTKCNRVFYSYNTESSYNSYFLRDCVNCSDCFASVNLRNKQYHIFNKPYTKSEYERELKEFTLGSYESREKLRDQALQFWLKWPVKFMHGRHNEKISGDYIYYSKNALHCFDVRYAEDVRYCNLLVNKYTKDCYDYGEWGQNAELIYECIDCGIDLYNLLSCYNCRLNCRNLSYCMFCSGSQNLFGCVSLNKRKHCILNKQYSKAEYEALVPKIINHMNDMPYRDTKGRVYRYGDFFPFELSPWGYNETTAQEYFKLSKNEAQRKGYNWYEPARREWLEQTYKIPDHIKEVKDDILSTILACAACGKNYRIIKPELAFYRQQNIPIPRTCPDCRHNARVRMRNPLKLWHRKCQCAGVASDNEVYKNTIAHFHKQNHCPNEFETSYMPERPEIVYCEKCYLVEVA